MTSVTRKTIQYSTVHSVPLLHVDQTWNHSVTVSEQCLHARIEMHQNMKSVVTKRRSSWACVGNPKLEQEIIKGTHAQETSAYQRRQVVLFVCRRD